MDFWPWQRVERCFWTKLASFRSISKPKCCGPSRRKIRPVGSTRRVPINVRILAATNRDLEQAVMQGEFRRDLYFRLNVLSLRISRAARAAARYSAPDRILHGPHGANFRTAKNAQRRGPQGDAGL